MKIDKMTADDCRELAELEKICFSVPWSERSFREEAENRLATYLLAREDGKIIGYCGFWRVSGEAQVTNIAVLPEYRRRGVAAGLMKKMLELCSDDSEIILEVRRSNGAAIALYERLGFEAAGIRKRFYHDPIEDGITMIRRKQ